MCIRFCTVPIPFVSCEAACRETSTDWFACEVAPCGAQANPEKMQPEWEEMAATSCAVQNLWLMGTALGVAGVLACPLHHSAKCKLFLAALLPSNLRSLTCINHVRCAPA